MQEPARDILAGHDRISLIPPLDYVSLVHLMRRSTLILTDSGGLQEEAPTFGKPVLVLRDVTERPEAVQAGCARIVGTEREVIVSAALELLTDRAAYDRMAKVANPFGDGHASSESFGCSGIGRLQGLVLISQELHNQQMQSARIASASLTGQPGMDD